MSETTPAIDSIGLGIWNVPKMLKSLIVNFSLMGYLLLYLPLIVIALSSYSLSQLFIIAVR